ALGVVGGVLLSGGEDTRTVQGKVEIASAPNARASLELSEDATKLSVRNMPPPPSGKVYQVWLKRPAQDPAPTTALFRVDPSGSADVEIQRGRLKGVEQVLVTAEPDGGAMAPTSDPGIVGSAAWPGGDAAVDRFRRPHGDLLPPPVARDGRVVLLVRQADLPGLHDAD